MERKWTITKINKPKKKWFTVIGLYKLCKNTHTLLVLSNMQQLWVFDGLGWSLVCKRITDWLQYKCFQNKLTLLANTDFELFGYNHTSIPQSWRSVSSGMVVLFQGSATLDGVWKGGAQVPNLSVFCLTNTDKRFDWTSTWFHCTFMLLLRQNHFAVTAVH